MNLFPSIRATLKAHSYFATTLGGFQDSDGRFKCFREGEAPSLNDPCITIDVRPGGRDQRTSWSAPYVIFHVHGKDTDWATLWSIAEQIESIFRSANLLTNPAGGMIQYQMLGSAEYDTGRDPVTEQVLVSVSLRFGTTE